MNDSLTISEEYSVEIKGAELETVENEESRRKAAVFTSLRLTGCADHWKVFM